MDNCESLLQEILEKVSAIEKKVNKLEKTLSNNGEGEVKKKISIKKSSGNSTKKVVVKTGSINMTIHPNGCRVTGETYDKKHIIKTCKGWWTPEIKGWTVKAEYTESLKQQLEETTKNLVIQEVEELIEGIESVKKSTSSKSKKEPVMYDSDGPCEVQDVDFLDDSD